MMKDQIYQIRIRTLMMLFFLAIKTIAVAQTPRFILQTDRMQVQEGETFLLEAVLENIDGKNIQLPDVTPFKIVQGPSTSTSISIINGKRSSTLSYQYLLLATKKGSFTIQPATLKIGSKVLKSNAVNIEVSSAKPAEITRGGSPDQQTFIRLEASQSKAYTGQQIVLNYVLYTRQNIESYDLLNEPDFEGFYAQPISDIRDQPQRKVVNGKEYYVQTIRRVVLFPQKTGKYTIGPVNCSVAVPVENGPSSFFFRETRKEQTTTNKIQLDVQQLPLSPPLSFSGAVGDFSMKAAVQKNTVVTGEAIVIRMEVEGDGDAKIVQAPQFEVPESLEKYEPSVLRDETFAKGDRIRMLKEFEYIFVPEKDTIVTIAPEFTFLSVATGKFVTIKAGPFTINVLKGDGKNTYNNNQTTETELSPLSQDTSLSDTRFGFFGSWTYLLSLFLIVFGTIAGVMIRKNREAAKLSAAEKASSAYSVAQANLKKAKIYLDKSDPASFYQELSLATTGYIMKKYHIPNVDSGQATILKHLEENGVPNHLITEYSQILNRCELAKFAGEYGNMEEEYNIALKLIEEV